MVVGTTFQFTVPVSLTFTVDAFDSQRVKDAEALLVRFRVALDPDLLDHNAK